MHSEPPDPHHNGQGLTRSLLALLIASIVIGFFVMMALDSIDKVRPK